MAKKELEAPIFAAAVAVVVLTTVASAGEAAAGAAAAAAAAGTRKSLLVGAFFVLRGSVSPPQLTGYLVNWRLTTAFWH